jgi:urease beta subunit
MIEGIAGQIRVGTHFHLFEDTGTVGADRFSADAKFVRDTF